MNGKRNLQHCRLSILLQLKQLSNRSLKKKQWELERFCLYSVYWLLVQEWAQACLIFQNSLEKKKSLNVWILELRHWTKQTLDIRLRDSDFLSLISHSLTSYSNETSYRSQRN